VRRAALLLALVLAGCNSPVCGPGTKRVQLKGGTVQCQPVDGLPDTIPCDADGGAVIVGGACVSRVQCGPGTKLDAASGLCVADGMASPCPPPAGSAICVFGTLHHFIDDSPLGAGETVHVGISDPLNLIAELDSTGTFVFPNVAVPSSGLVAIGAGDRSGTPNVVAATGAIVSPGKIYHVDAYVLPRSVVDGWQTQTGDDYLTQGAYVAKFYADPMASATDYSLYETMPVAGVTLLENGAPPARARYFGTSLTTIDKMLTATGASGTALIAAPPSFSTYSGMGGTSGGTAITWPALPGGSAPGVVFVTRFHPM
jgi:hypothetical protein